MRTGSELQNHFLAIWWNFCAWLSSEMAIVGSNTTNPNWDFVGLPKSTCSSPSYLVRCNNWLAHALPFFVTGNALEHVTII